jgi:hypothetical protein
MSIWSRLFGPNMPPLPQEGAILVIDYSSCIQKLGILKHGTIYLEGDKAGAMWSSTIMGERKTHTLEITPILFRSFWRALDRLPEFRKSWISDRDQGPDFARHNFVLMVMSSQSRIPLFKRNHAMDIDDASEQLRDLLMLVGVAS